MSTKKDGLLALEGLMKEFFDGRTRNEKRQEINGLLTNFSNQEGSWKLCIDYLAQTSNEYVCMFCLTTIENIINKQWMCLPWEEKAQIKSLMNAYILEKHSTLAPCIKSKSVKLVVDIARLDWPHFYPDFFINILQLLQKIDTRHLGLLFLLTTSEELITPREDLSVDRKAELQKLLLAQIPQVFNILLEFLSTEEVLTNTQDCSLLLKVFTHLFSWVPASQVPSPAVSIIFKLAANTGNREICLLAMSTLNEMLYRHWVPPNWNQIYYYTIDLLEALSYANLEDLDSSYLEKVSDFLRLALGLHLSLGDEEESANLDKIFAGTISFTMRQPTLNPGFMTCLDIWSHLLDNPNSKRCSVAFVSLAQQILNKIQFRQNRPELSDLDDKVIDDDGETEWQKFLRTCLEVVAKIADLQPLEILRLVFEQWVELCGLFGQICSDGNYTAALQDIHGVHCLLRDLSSFTQTMGRLHPHCMDTNWDDFQFSIGRLTVQHLLSLSGLASKTQCESLPDFIKRDFQNVHAHVLASLKSWCYWLLVLHDNPSTKSLLHDLITGIINECVPLLTPSSAVVLQHSSAHLISTVTSTVRPSVLWDFESIKCLFSTDLSHLKKEDQYLVQGGLVNCLILKWPNMEDQMWGHRLKLLNAYIEEIMSPFIRLPLEFNPQYKPIIISKLQFSQYIIKLYKSEGFKSKKLLCDAFQKSVEHSLALFPIWVNDPEVNQEILEFFLILLECLQQEVGVTFTQVTVQSLMNVFSRQQLQIALAHENGGGLQQLFLILDLVVQTPGLSASKLTPMAVNLCLQLSEPILSENTSPVVQESFFQLVCGILIHKWQYFFKSTLELEQRTKEFLQLMKTLGQSLFLPNIDLFRQNLKNLERLNSKWNLYYKEFFKKELYSEFLSVLLNTLVTKSHPIVNEEIAVAIYNLISADVYNFFNCFLPRYLDSVEALDPSQKSILLGNFTRDIDMPSVIQNIFRLTNDLICYRLCNSSLPPGSITIRL